MGKVATLKKEKIENIKSVEAKTALKNLFVSANNVRTIVDSDENNVMLKNSIMQFGLINPLAVTAELDDGKHTGRYAVVAGSRRLTAMNELLSDKAISDSYEVSIRIFDEADAVEISMIENATQKKMHAFDQFISYKTLLDSGKTLENVSVSHGVSIAHIKRCLCLSNASPKILDAFKKGEINNDQLMSLCFTKDHATQESVWFNAAPYNRSPRDLKSAIMADEMRPDNRKAIFVGVENYIARGGRVREDLFSENGSGNSLMDVALIETMVQERLSAEADRVKDEGWAWVEFADDFDWEYRSKFAREYAVTRETLTDEEKATQAALELEAEALEEEWNAFEEAEFSDEAERDKQEDALDKKRLDLDERKEAFESTLEEWPNGKEKLGVLLSVSYDGSLNRSEGYYIQERGKAVEGRDDVIEEKGYSQSLVSNLNAIRTEALQIELAKNINLSLTLLAHNLLLKVMPNYVGWDSAKSRLSIEATTPKTSNDIADYENSIVEEKKNLMIVSLGKKLPENSHDLLAYLLKQKQETVLELIAFCAGFTLDVSYASQDEEFKKLVELTGANMNEYFVPTVDNFLSRVSKDDLTTILEETNKKVDADIQKTKKKDYAKLVETAIEGTNWLPKQLVC